MAFALSEWCGFNVATHLGGQEPHLLCVELFSKLGGQYLGQVHVDKSKTLVELVKSWQHHASKLLVHPTRTSSYLVFFVDNTRLPSFTYHTNIEKKLEQEALDTLLKVNSVSRLECMYDEDDSQALQQVRLVHHFRMVGVYTAEMSVPGIPNDKKHAHAYIIEEFAVVRYTTNLKCLVIQGDYKIDCSVLSSSGLTELAFPGFARPVDWKFALTLKLKHITINLHVLHEVDFGCLPYLETLYVNATIGVCTKLRYDIAKRIPKNVKTGIGSRRVPTFYKDFPNICWHYMKYDRRVVFPDNASQ
jgi:hypothetical protein